MLRLHTVEVSVHKACKNGYRVKVSVLDLGVYINGVMVFPPDEVSDQWEVMSPSRLAGRGKYVRIIEFNKKMPLWECIYDACVEAVKLERANEAKDIVINDIPDGPISLDDIPF